MRPLLLFHRLTLTLVLVLLTQGSGVFADDRTSLGLYGDFDRLHLRDSGAQPAVNTILTCFGWGGFIDHRWLAIRWGLRSQLGTSSLDPGYVDDEQLVATVEVQFKYPVEWGPLVTVYPALGLEGGYALSGTVRNGEHYFPWLTKLAGGATVNLTDDLYLGAEASFSVSPHRLPVMDWTKPSTVFTVTEWVGWRLPG